MTSILEDSKGFLWFGTFAGINRYDGYKLITYKNTVSSEILSSNRIRSIKEDKKGNIWIGTDKGINLFNSTTQRFQKLSFNLIKAGNRFVESATIRKIIINNPDHRIVCLTEKSGIQVFDDNYKFLGEVKLGNDIGDKVRIIDGVQLHNNHYLLATSVGLVLFDIKNNKFKQVLKEQINHCNSVELVEGNQVLVTLGSGLAVVKFEVFENLISLKLNKVIFNSVSFTCSAVDKRGNLWLGSQLSGVKYVKNWKAVLSGQAAEVEFFNDGLPILKSSVLLGTTRDYCWLGTYNEGLYQFKIKESDFKSSTTISNSNYWNNANKVSNIEQFGDSKICLTSGLGGLGLFDWKAHKFEALPAKYTTNFKSLYLNSKKNSWIIDDQKRFYRIKNDNQSIQRVDIGEIPTADLRAFTFEKYGYGNVWVGKKNDAYKIILNKDDAIVKIESLNNNPFFSKNKLELIRCVYSDPKTKDVWIGTSGNGLFRIQNSAGISIEKSKIEHFVVERNNNFSIPSNYLTSIIRLPNGEMWIGTEGGGVSKVLEDKTGLKFETFTKENGLSNDENKNMLADEEGNLWISTNNGLNKLNTKNYSIRKFKKSDGLSFENFTYAAKRLSDGTMMFSGLNGFCYFNPKKITQQELLPKIEFENLKIFNKLIKPGFSINDRVLLNKSLGVLSEIELKYNENVFSLDIKSLHFSNPENHLLRYKLTPINKDWVEVASNQNTISYSGLQPGTYQLTVMASNSMNEWSPVKQLTITITPPFWKTNWAYLLYILFILGVGYVINRTILKIHLLNHKVEIEQLEKKKEQEFNEAKLRFFSNIYHEIKTPLTLISNPINNLFERYKGNPELGEKLSLVLRQSKKMQQLIEQVQDFTKADNNVLKLKYSHFVFNDFIKELVGDFKYAAEVDDKNLNLVGDELPIVVSADKDKLEKIFNNLLNNAFKYTEVKDAIKIEYKTEDKFLIVSVIDSGKGIDKVDLEHVFERFYQSHKIQNAHLGGSGIGLAFSKKLVEMHYGYITAESEINVGTTITVKLPIVKEQKEGELQEENIDLPKEEEISVGSMNNQSEAAIEISGDFKESLIFYVEDNDDLRNYVSGFLSKYFKVKSFRNGLECLNALDDEWPDIIVSDIQMPELNGLDLCRRVKSDIKTSHIPIILVTALTHVVNQLQGIRDGADAYIRKPFDIQILMTTIEGLLKNRKVLSERYQIGIPLSRDNKNNRNDNAFLEKFYSLLDDNLDNQDFNLKELASELCLSKSAFYQKVKTLTNQTPLELIMNYRLKRASEFLGQQGLSVSEVFIMTGFKNRTHFATKFKEKYNESPSKYAIQIKEKNVQD